MQTGARVNGTVYKSLGRSLQTRLGKDYLKLTRQLVVSPAQHSSLVTRHCRFLIAGEKILKTGLTPSVPTPNAFLIAGDLPLFSPAAPRISNRYTKLLEIELTRSQQTRKHFLIATICPTSAHTAHATSRDSRLTPSSAPACLACSVPKTLLYDTLAARETTLGKFRVSSFKRWGIALAAVAIIAYVASGLRYASYAPHRSGNYLWGVYHVHSTMSDGLLSPEEIAVQARATGVSLVLLTDHGTPNLASSSFRKIIDGVTIVGGSEANLPDGRLTFFGAQQAPGFRLSSFPPEAMDDARGWGAFPVLAYPDDPDYGWRYWDSDLRPGGIEVLNLFTSLRGASWADRLRLAMYYPFSHYYFLKSIAVPAESLAHWDGFLRRDKIWGLEASDAHGGVRIVSWFSLKVPSYADTFSYAGMGISQRYQSDPEAAVRSGDFFNCIRGAGEPDQFEFSAHYGFQDFPSGSDAPVNSSLHVELQASHQAVRVVLKKDGVALRESTGEHLDLENAAAGVYRVEVFLPAHPLLRADVPWILSNPIFVGMRRVPLPAGHFTAIRAQLARHADSYKR